MPVADWNERSRISFKEMLPKVSGRTKLSRIRSQPMASMLRGVITGMLAGLTSGLVVGVAADIVSAGVAVAMVAGEDGLLAYVVLGPAVMAKITCVSTPSSTSVVANR